MKIPESVLTKSQVKTYGPVFYTEHGQQYKIVAFVRHNDRCGNGLNSFSITGEIHRESKLGWEWDCGGCIHEDTAKRFPQLAPFIKWHLTSTDGPMYYIANTVYHASTKDCHGLERGEFLHFMSHGQQNGGVSGVPNWTLEIPDSIDSIKRNVYSTTKPEAIILEWQPCGITGEGKDRDLNAARHCAVWPDATDAELTEPGLEARLMARLPALMAEFKSAVESLGFVY